ncbi:MAG: AAA domain-containing protein [Pyrinomonadaceae bacterium]
MNLETSKKIIDYWRNSLADSARMNISFEKLKQAEKFTFRQIKSGWIPKETAYAIVKKYLDENNNHSLDSMSFAEILICPISVSPNVEFTQINKSKSGEAYLTPIWLTAKLLASGEILPADEPYIWIPRNYLEPTDKESQIIGNIDGVDDFLEQNPFPVNAEDAEKPLRWSDVWNYADEMLVRVSGFSIEEFQVENHSNNGIAFILSEENVENDNIRKNIIGLYDYLRNNHETPKLLSSFASLQNNSLKPLLNESQNFEKSAFHYGQMRNDISLSSSQRESLHHFLTIEDGEILAINGPPGTGKTTLLKSVVATMWIEAALNGNRQPPIIVATSTNNQAVTNVIGDFEIKSDDDSNLGGRWIPEVTSFGLYCPSESKIPASTNFQITFADKTFPENGFYLSERQSERINIEEEEFVSESEKYFLEQVQNYAGKEFINLERAVNFLRRRLIETTDEIRQGISGALEKIQIDKFIKNKYGFFGDLEKNIERLKADVEASQNEFDTVEKNKNEWIDFDNAASVWLKLFSFLSFVKKQITFRNQSFFSKRNLQIKADLSDAEKILKFFEADLTKLSAEKNKLFAALKTLQNVKQQSEIANQNWLTWQRENAIIIEPENLLDELDKTLRYRAFQLATHYWEGCWLIEMKEEISQNYNETKAVKKQQKRWRRYAKIAPCFVATFHSLPKFFKAWEGEDKPLIEFIDLLIVDEAGQVSPEVAGASFALAKKALVVGDTLQIEPVWSLNKEIDAGNLKRHKLIEKSEDADSIHESGLTVTQGNVMKIAQRASKYQRFEGFERGMFLAEHRRCVPEIIGYCNELAYHGRLVSKRNSIENYPLPHVGYAHVNGQSRKINGSRENTVEAEVLARWVAENQTFLMDIYKDKNLSLSQIIGIVTPFRRQSNLIKEKLGEFGVAEKITVGSVHSLQGAERPIIIFSSVHGTNDKSYFFERNAKPNMLNVAVSRAKDSFLVFGNMAIFNSAAAKRPAGLLAKYLFADTKNEITNIHIVEREELKIADNIYHLTTLEAHRKTLYDAFTRAKEELVIVSPYITEKAIYADNLPPLIKTATAKGVKVTIYTDSELNCENRKPKMPFVKGKDVLITSGAKVKEVRREHSKTLIVDRNTLIEGSFNWLSAVRDENSNYQRRERSIKYTGSKIASEITRTIEETESRVISK